MKQYISIAVFGLAVVVLFGSGHLLARKRRAAANGEMQPLSDAAALVYETARNEKMALVAIAQGSGDPVGWFARNIASIVRVWRSSGAGNFEAAAKGDGDTQSLYIRRSDVESYLRWARTVK